MKGGLIPGKSIPDIGKLVFRDPEISLQLHWNGQSVVAELCTPMAGELTYQGQYLDFYSNQAELTWIGPWFDQDVPNQTIPRLLQVDALLRIDVQDPRLICHADDIVLHHDPVDWATAERMLYSTHEGGGILLPDPAIRVGERTWRTARLHSVSAEELLTGSEEMLNRLQHLIRSPLTVLKVNLQLLERFHDDSTHGDEFQDMLQTVDRIVRELDRVPRLLPVGEKLIVLSDLVRQCQELLNCEIRLSEEQEGLMLNLSASHFITSMIALKSLNMLENQFELETPEIGTVLFDCKAEPVNTHNSLHAPLISQPERAAWIGARFLHDYQGVIQGFHRIIVKRRLVVEDSEQHYRLY